MFTLKTLIPLTLILPFLWQCQAGNYTNEKNNSNHFYYDSITIGSSDGSVITIQTDNLPQGKALILSDSLGRTFEVSQNDLTVGTTPGTVAKGSTLTVFQSPTGSSCRFGSNVEEGQINIECSESREVAIPVVASGVDGGLLVLKLDNNNYLSVTKDGVHYFPNKVRPDSDYNLSLISFETGNAPGNLAARCRVENRSGQVAHALIAPPRVDCDGPQNPNASPAEAVNGVKIEQADDEGFAEKLRVTTANGGLMLHLSGENLNNWSQVAPFQLSINETPTPYTLYDNTTLKVAPFNQHVYPEQISITPFDNNLHCNIKEHERDRQVFSLFHYKVECAGKGVAIIKTSGKLLPGNLFLYYTRDPLDIQGGTKILLKQLTENERAKIVESEIRLPEGRWYLRVFLDTNGDQLPTLGIDPQAPASEAVEISSNKASTVSAELLNTTFTSHFYRLNSYVYNEQDRTLPDGSNCGGTYLRLEASGFSGTIEHLSEVYVITPNGARIRLLDDGGCGNGSSNRWKSYDRYLYDNEFSAGIPLTTELPSGTYRFFYINHHDNMIHIADDEMPAYRVLPTYLILSEPNGKIINKNLTPRFSWNLLNEAKSYQFLLQSTDMSFSNYEDPGRFTGTNQYTLPENVILLDQKSYQSRIYAYDTIWQKSSAGEYDSVSVGPDSYFLIDFDGNSSKMITGKLKNQTGLSSDYLVYADGNPGIDSWESSSIFPGSAEFFSLPVFHGTGPVTAAVTLNYSGSGYLYSIANLPYYQLQSSKTGLFDFVWNTPIQLYTPERGGAYRTRSLVFSWGGEIFDKETSTQSYLVWVRSKKGNFMIGAADQKFEPWSAPQGSFFDATPLYQCLQENNNEETSSLECLNAKKGGNPLEQIKTIGEMTLLEWNVYKVDCDYNLLTYGVDLNRNGWSDYVDCLSSVFQKQKGYVASGTNWVPFQFTE